MPVDISNITVKVHDSSHVEFKGYLTDKYLTGANDKVGFFWRQAQPGQYGQVPFNVVLNDPSGAVGPSWSATYDGSGGKIGEANEPPDGSFFTDGSTDFSNRIFLPGVTYYANAYYCECKSSGSGGGPSSGDAGGYWYSNVLGYSSGTGVDDAPSPYGGNMQTIRVWNFVFQIFQGIMEEKQ